VYPSGDPAAAYYIDQIFGVRTDTTYTLGAYQNSRQIVETDLSLLPLRIKYGPGFDGNNSGGAMPTTALNIYGPLSELPEEEDCPPVGDFLGPEDDPIGDAIDEGIEDSIEEITGAQEAENILIQAGEAEIVVGLQQGPPGQENLLEEFIFSHDSTLTPGAVGGFGGVGPPINDAFEIAQELLNTGVNNAAGASNNAAGNVGNMAYGDFSTGNNVVDDAGNNMAAGNVAVEDAGANLNLINNLLINGLIG